MIRLDAAWKLSVRSSIRKNPEQTQLPPAPPPEAIAKYVHELSQLALVDRSGWLRLGLKAETLAPHVARSTQIAFFLAVMENHENPYYVVTLTAFHENAEARLGFDPNRIAKRYTSTDQPRAVRDQTANLGPVGESIVAMFEEVEQRSSPAGTIAKDADYLEMCFKARELEKLGVADAADWLKDGHALFRTESAKKLFDALMQGDPHGWWKNLSMAK